MSDFHFMPVAESTPESLTLIAMDIASLDDAKQFVRTRPSSDIPRRLLAKAARRGFEDGLWEDGLYTSVIEFVESCSMVHDRGWTIGYITPEGTRFKTERAIPVRVSRTARGQRRLWFGWRDFADKDTADFTINGVGVRVAGATYIQQDSGDFERDRSSWDSARRVGSHEEVTATGRMRLNETLEAYSNWINENHTDLVMEGLAAWGRAMGSHSQRVRAGQAREVEHLAWVIEQWRAVAEELDHGRAYIAGVVGATESELVHFPTFNRVGEVEIARLVLTSEVVANENGVVVGYIGTAPSQGGPRDMAGDPWVVPKSCVSLGNSVAKARANRGL